MKKFSTKIIRCKLCEDVVFSKGKIQKHFSTRTNGNIVNAICNQCLRGEPAIPVKKTEEKK